MMTYNYLDIDVELEKAENARLAGKEGWARVCARRAAGIIARDFLVRQGVRLRSTSVYAALQALAEFPGLDQDLRIAALHLITPVNVAFTLPMEADLIADARKLIGGLVSDIPRITMYGTTWCGDCRRARLLFDQHKIPYRFVDIDKDEKAARYVEGLNNGCRSVPTIVWADGSMLVEPSNDALAKKLGIEL
jgi:mycoredoxin